MLFEFGILGALEHKGDPVLPGWPLGKVHRDLHKRPPTDERYFRDWFVEEYVIVGDEAQTREPSQQSRRGIHPHRLIFQVAERWERSCRIT